MKLAILYLLIVSSSPAQSTEARRLFDRAVALPFDDKGLTNKEELYKQAIAMDPRYAPAHNNLGDVYERQRRYDEAMEEYERAAKIDPNLGAALIGVGDIHFRRGTFGEAVVWYEKGLARYREKDEFYKSRNRALQLARVMTETTIYFPTASAAISESDASKLDLFAKSLNEPELRDRRFEVQGHTDATGDSGANVLLSKRRAEAVREYLIKRGAVDPRRVTSQGYGSSHPADTGPSPDALAKNRRVEVAQLAVN